MTFILNLKEMEVANENHSIGLTKCSQTCILFYGFQSDEISRRL